VVCCGRDVNVRAAITGATAGSVLLAAGRDLTIVRSIVNPATDITVTNGNITLCAGHDVILSNTLNQPAALITMNDSAPTGDATHNLGLAPGLVISAGNAATAPGAAGGTVTFTPLTKIALTRAGAPVLNVTIDYNPASYAAPTSYAPLFTLVGGITLNQRMLVYPDGASKTFDGSTVATFTGLQGAPAGVTLNPGGIANFDTAAVGLNKLVTFSGFTLGGANAGLFALPGTSVCCSPSVQRTTANITAVPPPPPPPIPPIVPVPLPPFLPVPPVEVTGILAEEMLGREREVQEYLPVWSPTVTEIRTPPQLLSIAPPVVVPPPPPVYVPPVYVPPVLPPKQDRN